MSVIATFDTARSAVQARIANQPAHYSRIVGKDENLHQVLLEAIEHGCHVWTDPELKKTVICRNKPAVGKYNKVHANYRMPVFGPEAA